MRTVVREGHSSMSAQYFFHLYNGPDVILDEIGVEVSELDQVRDALAQTVREMLRAQQLNMSELEGWEVRVVDAAAAAVMTVGLGDLKDLSC
jgi:Domain of unknown function (DUF6894)